MVWIVIAAILIAAIGPLFWLLPSRRERQQAAWRNAARAEGLIVELASVDKPDASAAERVTAGGEPRAARRQCAAYRLPLLPPIDDAPRWLLLKSPRENRYLPGWTTPHPPTALPTPAEGYWQALAPLLAALPGGCIGVEANARTISWLGLETADEDDAATVAAAIGAGLAAIAALQRQVTDADRVP